MAASKRSGDVLAEIERVEALAAEIGGPAWHEGDRAAFALEPCEICGRCAHYPHGSGRAPEHRHVGHRKILPASGSGSGKDAAGISVAVCPAHGSSWTPARWPQPLMTAEVGGGSFKVADEKAGAALLKTLRPKLQPKRGDAPKRPPAPRVRSSARPAPKHGSRKRREPATVAAPAADVDLLRLYRRELEALGTPEALAELERRKAKRAAKRAARLEKVAA